MKNEKRFGKTYSYNGELSSDYLIKTRGDVVVQSGRKFIKLISGGKINIDVDTLKRIEDLSDLNNQKNGIYYTDNGDVYIKIEDNIISLSSKNDEDDNSYVSHIELQNIDDFSIAQKNIKLIVDDINSIDVNSLPDKGLIFDYNTEKIYYIKDYKLIELSLDIPELINHNIKIDGENILGSLALLGIGKNKGFSIGDTLYMYIDSDGSKISSDVSIDFIIGGDSILSIQDNGLVLNPNHKIIANHFKSNSGNFEIIDDGTESTIYVDNIVTKNHNVRYEELIDLIINNRLISDVEYTITDFQNEWEIQKDVDMLFYEDIYEVDEDENILYHDSNKIYPKIKYKANVRELIVKATASNKISPHAYYKKSGYNVIYDISPRDIETNKIVNISDIDDDFEIDEYYKGVILRLTDEFNNTANYDFKNLKFYNPNTNEWCYTFNSIYNSDESLLGTISNNIINLKDYQIKSAQYKIIENEFEEEEFVEDYIIDLNDNSNILIFNNKVNNSNFNEVLNSNIFNNSLDFVSFDTLDSITLDGDLKYAEFHGKIENINFIKDKYPLLYDLNKQKDIYRNGDNYDIIFIPDLIIPSGFIAMWFKPDIPKGWVICDGNNGTPNLIDKFIKGSDEAGNTGGNKEISLTLDNLPKHSHDVEITRFSDKEQLNNFEHTHDFEVGNDTFNNDEGSLKPLLFKSSNTSNIKSKSASIEENISTGIIDVKILDEGKGTSFKIEPEYYSMIFIMKV